MRHEVTPFLLQLREKIIAAFEEFDVKRFVRTPWSYQKGNGGGEMAVLRGKVFEKAAVNFSSVEGKEFPGDDAKGPFFATGISLITHMTNPKAPTLHFNLRYIEAAGGSWFGGGYDLTPMGFPFDEDTNHFHSVAKGCLDEIDPALYPRFRDQAKEYFFIKHRGKERGVGGLFFDHFDDVRVWKKVGETVLDAILPIYQRRVNLPFTPEDKHTQLLYRGHYAEFNLAYDRGTKFGFLSGGNPEAILCSMPPEARW